MAIVLGITGLMGAGKSVVVQTFKQLYNTPTFDCDAHAKAIYREDYFRGTIIKLFGFDPILRNGVLNKDMLMNTLDNPILKVQLEGIIHNAVKEKFLEFASNISSKVIVIESAILFSSGLDQLCRYTVAVKADSNMRKQRVLRRDAGRSPKQYEQVAALQIEEKQLQERLAHYSINNSGSESIIKAVESIWSNIINRQQQ